jgi:NAD(P)H-flavin reductase
MNPLMPLAAEVLDTRAEARDTFTLTLAFKDRQAQNKYRYKPGQFNMVSLFGLGEAPISMSSDPAERATFEHTVKVVGGVTQALSRLSVGDPVGVRGPYGTSWPIEEAGGKDVLIVAGGIGLAPLRPVIEHILGNRTVYGEVTILYGARTPQDLSFERDFERWTVLPKEGPGIKLLLTVDKTDGDRWAHNVGVVPTLFEKVKLNTRGTVGMMCGPEVMLRFGLVDLIKRGFPMDRLFISMERRMSCGVAQCGHCFFGPKFVCRDGPVFRVVDVYDLLGKGV